MNPLLRVLYEFTCADCERIEYVRWPYNPMQEPPTILQCVPEGWGVIFDGDNIQSPVVMCGCNKAGERPGEAGMGLN